MCRCSEQRQRIVLPEGSEPRVLRAAAEVSRRGLADITLLGNAHAIQARAPLPALNPACA